MCLSKGRHRHTCSAAIALDFWARSPLKLSYARSKTRHQFSFSQTLSQVNDSVPLDDIGVISFHTQIREHWALLEGFGNDGL